MSKMLLDDQPLLVLPKLATKIGLNESIVVQQIHYWLLKKSNSRDGYYWVYNTSKDWVEQFPFWSESTVKRTLKNLEEKKLIVTGNYNKLQIDRTKWYRINYEELKKYDDTEVFDGRDRLGQIDTMDDSNWHDGQVNMTRPLPETTTKTTTDKKTSRHKYETCDMESAELLYQLMLNNNPNTKKPNFDKWANDIRMIRTIDRYTTEQIDFIIKWTQQDSFWKSNILSPAKLRKQFAGLVIKMKAQNERKQQYQKPINPWEEYMYEQAGSGSITNDDKRGVSERIKFIE